MLTFEEIRAMIPKDGMLDVSGENKEFIAIHRYATDMAGTYIWKVFKRVDENQYVEFAFEEELETVAKYLARSVTSKRIIKEVVQKLCIADFVDLHERVMKKPKVTVGVQRGSCVMLYVKGKKGCPSVLQLTE